MFKRWVGQEVASQLFGDEYIQGFIGIHRLDHPVPVGKDGSLVIQVESMGIAVAYGIQPVTCLVLTEARAGHEFVDQSCIGIGTRIGQKIRELFRFGWQTA